MTRSFGAALAILLVAATAGVVACRRPETRGAPPAASATPITGAVGGARPVRFDAVGGAVNGHTYGRPGPSAIVLVADAGREAEVWGEPARELAAAGFYVLAFAPTAGAATEAEIGAALRFVRGQGAEKFVLIGEGAAGAAALTVAAGRRLNGVGVLSPPLTYQGAAGTVETAAALPRIDAPLLILGALGDAEGAAAARRLYDAAREPRTLALAPGTARGAGLLGSGGESVRTILRDFLREAFAARAA